MSLLFFVVVIVVNQTEPMMSRACRRVFSVAALSGWNSSVDHLRDPALELRSVRRKLKTLLFAHY